MPVFTGPRDILPDLMSAFRSGLPADVASIDRNDGDVEACATMMEAAEGQLHGWTREARLATAGGKWLNQHARDRGTARQAGESDATLRQRLRTPPDAITPPAMRAALEALAATAGVGAVYLYELYSAATGATFTGWSATQATSFCDRGARLTREYDRTICVFIVPAAIGAAAADEIRLKLAPGRRYLLETY